MKVLKYQDYSNEILAEEFLKLVGSNPILESKDKKIDDSTLNRVLGNLSKDLKFNLSLVTTFGTGIKVLYPIVWNFVEKGLIKIEPTIENIILVCITSLSIIYLEENNNKAGGDQIECGTCQGTDQNCVECGGHGHVISQVTKADAQTLLTELKMRGVGNGVIKNLVKLFHKVGDIGKNVVEALNKLKSAGFTIVRNIPVVIDGFLDMFGYTQLMVPIINAISVMSGTYTLTWDNLWTNLAAIGTGILTLITRRQYQRIWDYLKNIGNTPNIPSELNSNDYNPINEQ